MGKLLTESGGAILTEAGGDILTENVSAENIVPPFSLNVSQAAVQHSSLVLEREP